MKASSPIIAAVSQSMSVTWVQECFAQKVDGGWWMVDGDMSGMDRH